MANSTVPFGLFYYDSAVPDDLLRDVVEWFDDSDTQEPLFPVANAQGRSSEKSRRVLHFGWKYNYSSGSTRERAEEFPLVIATLRDLIAEVWSEAPDGFDIESLDQCIVNRYLPGQGIGAHIDSESYGGTIVCFTFLGSREMEFTQGSDTHRVYTTPGSMYVMIGESRYEWKHQMRPRKSDTVNGRRVSRETCFSVTFRGVRK